MGNKVAFLLGLLVGGLVGWVSGVLSAPQSGKETRGLLSEKAIELRDKAEYAAESVKEEILGPLTSTENLGADYTRQS